MPPSESVPIIQAQEILNKGHRLCWEELNQLARRPEDIRAAELVPTLHRIFDIMAAHLLRVSKLMGLGAPTESQTGQSSPDFYFWPGYDSIISTSGTRRVTRTKAIEGVEISAGVGFVLNSGDLAPENQLAPNLTEVAFEQLLSPEKSLITIDGVAFAPGGTHGWAASGDIQLRDETILNVLAVSTRARPEDTFAREGFLLVGLSGIEPLEWGPAIARTLADPRLLRKSLEWPHVEHRGAPDSSSSPDENLQNVRELLYSVWLTVVFGVDNPGNVFRAASHQFNKYLDDQLSGVIDKLSASDVPKTAFNYWYTLALPKALTLPELEKQNITSELGSAMFLTTYRLEAEFFALVGPWIQNIYLGIRHFELLDPLCSFGENQQASVFAHQTIGLISQPWGDKGRLQMSEYSQFSLWMLRTLITFIWGSISWNPLESFHKGPTLESTAFPTWFHLTERQALEKVTDIAIWQGIVRTTRSPDPIGETPTALQEDISRKKKSAKRAVLKFLNTLLPLVPEQRVLLAVAEYRTRLTISVRSEVIPSWSTSQGFVFAYYHALWQAVHHAIVAAEQGETGILLWIEFQDEQCLIYNRSAYDTTNSGVARQLKDTRFYAMLRKKTNGLFSVIGPERTADKQIWRTRIPHIPAGRRPDRERGQVPRGGT